MDEVDVNNLRYLRKEYLDMPIQAYRGCLDGIKPVMGIWSVKHTERLLEMVSDRELVAKITFVDDQVRIFCGQL